MPGLSWLLHRQDGLWLRGLGGEEELLASEVAGFAVGPSRGLDRIGPIALLRYLDEVSRVSVLAGRRGGERTLYETVELVTSLAWHPSGTKCAFVASAPDGSGLLVTAFLDDSEPQTVILQPRHAYAQPVWSEDGLWFAIEGQPIDELRGMTIFGGHADGTLEIVDPLDVPLPKCTSPWFAPESSKIVYTYTDLGAVESQLRICDLSSPNDRRILASGGVNVPRWSADGRHVIAARHTTICETELVRIDARTGELEVLVGSGSHIAPVAASMKEVTYIVRGCRTADEIPDAPGELRVLDLQNGADQAVSSGVIGAALLH